MQLLEELKKIILQKLEEKNKTITELQESLERKLGFSPKEHIIMRAIGVLEREGKIIQSGFLKVYEPDGCAAYLAKYGLLLR